MSSPFYPPQSHFLPLATIRRERTLPWQGEVLARVGQHTEPSDVVARAGRPRPYLILDVTQKLQVSPELADQSILKLPGEPVHQGETLAQHKEGWGSRRKIASPVEGKVTAIKSGRMIIRPMPELYELRALIPGTVSNITPGYGVTIETFGALIQGTWGSGKEGSGALKMGVSEPGASMTASQIDVGHHGVVLVCGSTLDPAVLEKASEIQVRGLIVGGVPARLAAAVSQQVVPVIATEGMGNSAISKAIFTLLQANEGREAVMLAVSPNRWLAARPEIIIPLPSSGTPELPPEPGMALSAGQRVRIRRAPYQGAVGSIQAVYEEPRYLDNGIKCLGVDVVLENGAVAFVPHVNVELIGR